MLTLPTFAVGSMVRARGREWVVLPSEDAEVLRLRPLGGSDDDARGFFLPVEGDDIAPAALALPDPDAPGSGMAAGLLRDAVRLGFRSAAGPLRSVGRLSVQPHPYQLVPLLMALRLEPVRLLIGDDVGVGKTIEAAMIARELLDRGEVRRLCVLCPPHLCEQWQGELTSKFHLPAVVVRPGTVGALERDLPLDSSVFAAYPCTVVSIDFIKSDRRRAQFSQTCPEFVIVDEAHTAAQAKSGAQQQRHSLLRELARDPRRHLVLTTATPHSGDPGAFASLIGLLAPALEAKVAALELEGGSRERAELARHFVQRRRADVVHYLEQQEEGAATAVGDGAGAATAAQGAPPAKLTGRLRSLEEGMAATAVAPFVIWPPTAVAALLSPLRNGEGLGEGSSISPPALPRSAPTRSRRNIDACWRMCARTRASWCAAARG